VARLHRHNVQRRLHHARPPLPTVAVAAWHSEAGCTPSAWVDYIAGLSLTGLNTPVVSSDPGFFHGRTVAQSAITGGKGWRNAALGTVLASATRPWCYAVGRARTASGTQVYVGQAGANDDYTFQGSGGPLYVINYNNAGKVLSGPAVDTAVHRVAWWLDGTNANISVDGSVTSSAYVNALAENITKIAVGCAGNSAAVFSDFSAVLLILCSAKPTTLEETVLDAWAREYYGLL
jgi:hypothetical protein